jgi:fatty-acyl-CoA synthase
VADAGFVWHSPFAPPFLTRRVQSMEKHQSIGHESKDSNSGHLRATPVNKSLALKPEGFTSLLDALDYAAGGDSGFNFYNQHGELESVLSYSELREHSQILARRLLSLGCEHGDRVGIVAETNPMFPRPM